MIDFTVKEALSTLQWLIERNPEYADKPLLVTTYDKSMGGRASVQATSINVGFDWEHGQIRVAVDEPIIKKYNDRDKPKEKWLFTERHTNRKYAVCSTCTRKVGRGDDYCKHCGQ